VYAEDSAEMREVQVFRIPQSLGKFLLPSCSFHSKARERNLIFPPKRGLFRLSRSFWCSGCGCQLTWACGSDRKAIEEFLEVNERLAVESAMRVGALAQ
jgi:hypothetical protein